MIAEIKIVAAEFAERVFHLARRCAISHTGRDREHSGLHGVNPELGGSVRLYGTFRGILRKYEGMRNGANRTAGEN
jgi:hypothetical protein